MKWLERIFQLLARGHRAAQMLRAAGKGNRPLVEELLAKGADANAKEEHGWTPMHLAMRRGSNQDAVALLRKYGAKN